MLGQDGQYHITCHVSHVAKTAVLARVTHISSSALAPRSGPGSWYVLSGYSLTCPRCHSLWFEDYGAEAGCQQSNTVTSKIPLMMPRPATASPLGSQDPLEWSSCPGPILALPRPCHSHKKSTNKTLEPLSQLLQPWDQPNVPKDGLHQLICCARFPI